MKVSKCSIKDDISLGNMPSCEQQGIAKVMIQSIVGHDCGCGNDATDTSPSSAWSLQSMMNSLIAGYAAGICGTLVGHPFDSAKVWLQTQYHTQTPAPPSTRQNTGTSSPRLGTTSNSLSSPVFQNLRNMHTSTFPFRRTPTEILANLRALYAGVHGPLLSVGLVQAMNFAVYDSMRRLLYNGRAAIDDGRQHLKNEYLYRDSLLNIAVASASSGLVLAYLTSPLIITKVLQQTTPGLSFRDALRQTWRVGPYLGWAPHLLSETMGRVIYFVSYESIKRWMVQFRVEGWKEKERMTTDFDKNTPTPQHTVDTLVIPTLYERMASASLAGIICWSLIFPLDSLRSRVYAQAIRSDNSATSSPIRSWVLARQIYQAAGWRGFYRGFLVTIIRAGPVAAVVLPVYDVILDSLADF